METDIRYYRRRACEEMGAARRAVTEAARDRRLQLVDLYLARLDALEAPSPFSRNKYTHALEPMSGRGDQLSAFDWPRAGPDQRN